MGDCLIVVVASMTCVCVRGERERERGIFSESVGCPFSKTQCIFHLSAAVCILHETCRNLPASANFKLLSLVALYLFEPMRIWHLTRYKIRIIIMDYDISLLTYCAYNCYCCKVIEWRNAGWVGYLACSRKKKNGYKYIMCVSEGKTGGFSLSTCIFRF